MSMDETKVTPSAEVKVGSGGELPKGTALGVYIIQRKIAEGGCGAVYEAKHGVLDRKVAIKVMKPELACMPRMIARFVLEAQAVTRIKHPGIVDIFDFPENKGGPPFYVMEYLEGQSLREYLEKQGRLTPREALSLLEPVCEALHAAHEAGFVHRDLKAANVMLCEVGGSRRVKLLDFGIAKLLQPEGGMPGLTLPGHQMGTISSMAPEQLLGQPVDRRTDIFALGILLHHLLTGQLPYKAETCAEMESLLLTSPAPKPSRVAPVPQALDAVVSRCLERQKEARFPDVPAFVDALRKAVGADAVLESVRGEAMGVWLQLHVDEHGDVESALDEAMALVDLAADQLLGVGMHVAVQTSNTLLAVLPMTGSGDSPEARARRALEGASTFLRVMAESHGHAPACQVTVCLHAAELEYRTTPQGTLELVGGEVLRVGAWTPKQHVPFLCATPEAAKWLPEFSQDQDGLRAIANG